MLSCCCGSLRGKRAQEVQFVPGHGQMSNFGWERKTNPYVCDLALQIQKDLG